ncbi:MAG: stage III sporulation protein AF [Hespellia sp.]|nr:stage III sporulation protein AF [Hespellia sp.]
MQNMIYDWIQNLSVYIILMMAVLQLISNAEYRKYFRFFSGLLLILLLLTPLLRLTGMEQTFYDLYHSIEYRQEKEAIAEYESYLKDASNLWEEEE